MKDLSHYVVFLDLAKEMKELGFKQESLFYWWRHKKLPDEDWKLDTTYRKESIGHENLDNFICISAYTSGELGEMLPEYYYSVHSEVFGWCCFKSTDTKEHQLKNFDNDTEANARAKLAIHLKKNGVI